MLTKAEAKKLIEAKLDQAEVKLAIVSDVAVDYGWVFFWNSQNYLETGDIMQSLLGNGPYLVNKFDNTIQQLGTYCWEDSLGEYEKELKPEIRGNYGLYVECEIDEKLQVLKVIREVMNLSLSETSKVKANLPGVVLEGGYYQLYRPLSQLEEQGIQVTIQKVTL